MAHEFRGFDEGAVVAICEQTFSPYDTQRERNHKIGKLVVRWRAAAPLGESTEQKAQSTNDAPAPAPALAPAPAPAELGAEPDPVPADPPLDLTDLPAIWARACALLQMRMPRSAFEACLDRTALLALAEGVATIGFLRPAQREQAQDTCMAAIRRALYEVTGLVVQVRCVLRRA